MQNAAARLITKGAKRRDHIAPILRQLHWLPVRQWLEFMIASLVLSNTCTYLHSWRYSLCLRKFCSLPQVFFGEKVLCHSCLESFWRHVLLQLDHVSGITYLPCEIRKSAAQNSGDNCKHSRFKRTAVHRDFFDYCALWIHLLTYIKCKFLIFTARRVCISRTMPWQDVCLSVCHTPAFCGHRWKYPQNYFTVRLLHHSSFSKQNGMAIFRRGLP